MIYFSECTTVQKFRVCKIFNVFGRISYAHQGCNIVKMLLQFKRTVVHMIIFLKVIYSCDGKVEFSAAVSPVFK